MNNIEETIKDRFQNQSDRWESNPEHDYNIFFLKEMINQAEKNGIIRIFYSHRIDHLFSDDVFVEKLSDKIEENTTVEIFTKNITSSSILESNFLSRMTFYQIMERKNIHVRRTPTNFTMTQEGKLSFIDFIVISNSFLILPKTESGDQYDPISCVNDNLSVQTLNRLFDDKWQTEHDVNLQTILNATETE